MKHLLPIAASFAFVTASVLAQDITFSQKDRAVPYPAQSFIQGDINHDGIPDFLGVSPALDIYAFKSDGIGNYVDWTIPTAYCPSNPLAFGDFKRNGKADLLVSTSAGASCSGPSNSTQLQRRSNAMLSSWSASPNSVRTSGGTFADYLGDGYSGSFSLYKKFPTSSNGALAAVTADFTGDQILDTVILDGNTLELYIGDGHGGFSGPHGIAILAGSAASRTGGFYNLVAGDYDANGCTDLAWIEAGPGNLAQIKVAYGDCHGNFVITTPIANAVGEIDNIQTTDLDRDGASDIVVTVDAFGGGVNGPTLGIGYGQKDRTFNIKLIGDPSLSGPIAVADMNGDGFPDIAYISTSASGTEIKILQGDATQSFAAISTQPLPDANGVPEQMAFGDYNRDGKTDLAMLSTGSGNGQVFSIFTNTSAYPDGACVVPVDPGIHICSPLLISGSTVNVLAGGKSDNPAVFMELWVDGVKRVGYGSTSELRATLNLTPGWHRFGYYAIDAAAIKAHEVAYVFVK
jgi:hypothetical protein